MKKTLQQKLAWEIVLIEIETAVNLLILTVIFGIRVCRELTRQASIELHFLCLSHFGGKLQQAATAENHIWPRLLLIHDPTIWDMVM
jgi:hypothetical protein